MINYIRAVWLLSEGWNEEQLLSLRPTVSRQRGGAEVSSSHPYGIPHGIHAASLQRRAEAVQRRLFHVLLLVLSSRGCCAWSGGQLGTWLCVSPVVRLARVSRNAQYIQRSLGAASTLSETGGELEEGGCLLIRGPSLQAYSQIIASYRRLVLLFGLSVFK